MGSKLEFGRQRGKEEEKMEPAGRSKLNQRRRTRQYCLVVVVVVEYYLYIMFPPRARKNDSTYPIIMKGMCRIRRLQIGHVQQQQQQRRSTRDRENRQVKMISILDD
jgi:hypothetical protein